MRRVLGGSAFSVVRKISVDIFITLIDFGG